MSEPFEGPPVGPPRETLPVLDCSENLVFVLHGGYNPPHVLCKFHAFRRSPTSPEFGVPFALVFDAAFVIAKGQNGSLRPENETEPISRPSSSRAILPPGYYVYELESGEVNFPVLQSFSEFVPPATLPPHWQAVFLSKRPKLDERSGSSVSDIVKSLDQACLVTGASSALECAHLIPRSQGSAGTDWWGTSGHLKNTGWSSVDNTANCITLRSDLKGSGLDQGHFVFAPYDGRLAVIFLTNEFADLAEHHHLRAVPIPDRILPMNVYVRFVWNILLQSQVLLESLHVEFPRNHPSSASTESDSNSSEQPDGAGYGLTRNFEEEEDEEGFSEVPERPDLSWWLDGTVNAVSDGPVFDHDHRQTDNFFDHDGQEPVPPGPQALRLTKEALETLEASNLKLKEHEFVER
ncbi:hypothetical protein HMN09_00404300 [Mycena chlorophos]|uniref:HNH nuclease domain-containing protein n=1 Tax=Mycena chlorophos TaxID=658473 RepID=A0A8H6WGD8_MYCCL|nr:hypothetical protein HMN09_00404300 [Mycena chlorophos]